MSTYSHPTLQKSRRSDERLRTSRVLCVLTVAALLLGHEAFAQSSLNYERYAKAIRDTP